MNEVVNGSTELILSPARYYQWIKQYESGIHGQMGRKHSVRSLRARGEFRAAPIKPNLNGVALETVPHLWDLKTDHMGASK